MRACSSRHCEYPDQSRGSHFTMLTPRENLDVDSEDSEPAPHRHSGFRVVAEGGLQLSQFLTRISNKRSSEIRVYSFQSRKPLPMTTKMGDLPLKMSIQIWSEDLAKAIEDGLKSCHVKSADKDDAKDYKVFFIRHISSWEFFDSCETDRAQQDRRIQQLSDEVNSLRTRLENLERAQSTRWGGGLPHDRRAIFPFGSASKGARPALLWLWVADPWRSRFTAVPRLENEGFQNFHSQFIGRYNYSGLRFGLRLPAFSFTITCGNLTVGHFLLQLHVAILQWDYVLNDGFQLFRLQMHVAARFFPVECPGSRGNLPESCSGKPTQRGH